jgi:hypothetical protein
MKRSLAILLGLVLALGAGAAWADDGILDGYIPYDPADYTSGREWDPPEMDRGDSLCRDQGIHGVGALGGAKENFACSWLWKGAGNTWWKGVYDFDSGRFFDGVAGSCFACFDIKAWLDIEVNLYKEIMVNRVYFHVGNMHGSDPTIPIGDPIPLTGYLKAHVSSNAPVFFGLMFEDATSQDDMAFKLVARNAYPPTGPNPVEPRLPDELNGDIPATFSAMYGKLPDVPQPGDPTTIGTWFRASVVELARGWAAYWRIPAYCDHWIWVKIDIEVPYHKAHGRYLMEAHLNAVPQIL